MTAPGSIPAFGLYGEQDPFPDVLHCEPLEARAPLNDWRILPHRHDQMAQLFVLRDGHAFAQVDSTRHGLEGGQFLYVPPRAVHGFAFRPQTDGTVFSFPQAVIGSLSPDTTRIVAALSSPLVAAMTPPLWQLTDLLATATAETGPFRAQRIVGLAHSVLALLAEQQTRARATPEAARPARLEALETLIATHMAEGWTAARYAQALSVTTGHLSRLCREATGLGAAAYIEQRVMAEASRLLAFTQLPIAQIGYRLGYEDPSHFSKRVRAALGQTPTAYRARFTHAGRAHGPPARP